MLRHAVHGALSPSDTVTSPVGRLILQKHCSNPRKMAAELLKKTLAHAQRLADLISEAHLILKPEDMGFQTTRSIETRLRLICMYLKFPSPPPSSVPQEFVPLCNDVLETVQHITREAASQEDRVLDVLRGLWGDEKWRRTKLGWLCKDGADSVRRLKTACDKLLQFFMGDKFRVEVPRIAPVAFDGNRTGSDDAMLKSLQTILNGGHSALDPPRHDLKLHLLEGDHGHHSRSHCLSVIISSLEKNIWQEFCLQM